MNLNKNKMQTFIQQKATETRRRFLKQSVTILTGVLAVSSGCLDRFAGGGGQETIRLGGDSSGWRGQEPSEIENETNPTLTLDSGTTYKITRENLDGAEHELIMRMQTVQNSKNPSLVREREKQSH